MDKELIYHSNHNHKKNDLYQKKYTEEHNTL